MSWIEISSGFLTSICRSYSRSNLRNAPGVTCWTSLFLPRNKCPGILDCLKNWIKLNWTILFDFRELFVVFSAAMFQALSILHWATFWATENQTPENTKEKNQNKSLKWTKLIIHRNLSPGWALQLCVLFRGWIQLFVTIIQRWRLSKTMR